MTFRSRFGAASFGVTQSNARILGKFAEPSSIRARGSFVKKDVEMVCECESARYDLDRAGDPTPPASGRAMTEGSERGARSDRPQPPRARGHAAGSPRFVNRTIALASKAARGCHDWVPLSRVRPLGGALHLPPVSVFGRIDSGGARPFAPRVAIDRASLPGSVRLSLDCDFEARLARASQAVPSLPTPKHHDRPIDVGGGFPGVAFVLLYSSCSSSQRGDWMRAPAVKSLESVTLEEALAYLDAADGDELSAAFSLATHRNELGGSAEAPDDTEVHHALFLLRRARGLDAPSFDLMRVQLKRRAAA
jgi:hypothetical protein